MNCVAADANSVGHSTDPYRTYKIPEDCNWQHEFLVSHVWGKPGLQLLLASTKASSPLDMMWTWARTWLHAFLKIILQPGNRQWAQKCQPGCDEQESGSCWVKSHHTILCITRLFSKTEPSSLHCLFSVAFRSLSTNLLQFIFSFLV